MLLALAAAPPCGGVAALLLCRFCVVGFFLLALAAYAAFMSSKVNKLEERLLHVSSVPHSS